MPGVDIIQLKTTCYDIKTDLGYPNFFILGQSHQAHMFQPNTTDHTITYRTPIGRITLYSLSPSQLMRSHLLYNFWLQTVFLNIVYRCDNN